VPARVTEEMRTGGRFHTRKPATLPANASASTCESPRATRAPLAHTLVHLDALSAPKTGLPVQAKRLRVTSGRDDARAGDPLTTEFVPRGRQQIGGDAGPIFLH
jgi:hypothetical protein